MNNERVFWRRRTIFRGSIREQRNPYFPEKRSAHPKRTVVLYSSIVCLCVFALAGYAFFSAFFRIEYIVIDGNTFLSSERIREDAEKYVQSRSFGMLPRTKTILISTNHARKALLDSLSLDQAIENITVEKMLPNAIRITLKEKIPSVVYTIGGIEYLVDRSGVITKTLSQTERRNPLFPRLLDQTTRPVQTGMQALPEQIVTRLFELQDVFMNWNEIPIDFYYLPHVTCDTIVDLLAEQGSEEETISKNENTNTADDATESSNTNSTNRAIQNSNKATTQDEKKTCSLADRMKQQNEIRVRSTDDWEIYFRIDRDFASQIERLKRVWKERRPAITSLDYIDLRFGEQVIIK